jgi:NADH-quinone oxidoreductase subunit B
VARAGAVELSVAERTVRVLCLGLACCAVEAAEAMATLPFAPAAPEVEGGAVDVHVLVVAGTVTRALLPEVRRAWADLPEPRAAVAFGACTISGGPYWDSYAVVPGLRAELPGAVEVAGCPPRPDLLAEALTLAVQTAVDADSSAVPT